MNRETLLSRLSEMHAAMVVRDDRIILDVELSYGGVRAIAKVSDRFGGRRVSAETSVNIRAFEDGLSPQFMATGVYDRLQEQLVRCIRY